MMKFRRIRRPILPGRPRIIIVYYNIKFIFLIIVELCLKFRKKFFNLLMAKLNGFLLQCKTVSMNIR